MAKGDRIVIGHSSREGCTHYNLSFLLLFIFILTNSSVTSIRITQFPSFFREKGKMYFQSPRTNSSRHHCRTDLFPQVHFFIREDGKVARLTRHTGLDATQVYFPHSSLSLSLSLSFSLFSQVPFFFREGENFARLTRYTGVNATQDYFPHSSLFFSSFSFFFFFAREGENIAYLTCHTGVIATQDYFHTGPFFPFFFREGEHVARLTRLTGVNATQDYFPHSSLFFSSFFLLKAG